ncbi:hypothetical protein ABBQ32_005303 [Trebouxia sp. C0010 RCD-2024]
MHSLYIAAPAACLLLILVFVFSSFIRRPQSPIAAALKLESSAPPMDLDRPQGSSAQPLDLPQPSPVLTSPAPDANSASTLVELAQSSKPFPGPKGVVGSLRAVVAIEPEALNQSAMASSDAESVVKHDEARPAEAESAAEATEAESAIAVEAALRSESTGGKLPSTLDKPVQLEAADKSQGHINPPQHSIPVVAVDASGVMPDRLTESSAHVEDGQKERQATRGDGQGERQDLDGAGSVEKGSHRGAREEVLPSTDEDLDTAMHELAQEVSQLQPGGQAAAGEGGPAGQGSYLQRHTSSLILKMSQDAALPPLPAVANLGPHTRSQAASVPVMPGTPVKPGSARKTIKSMAASLFRAFDEGKLRERGPALAHQQGATGLHIAEQPLTATIRTYRSSPPKRREGVQQSASPARTVSYPLQKASLRRSLSPNIGRRTSWRQPEWDSSKPARPSPQRAQRASADFNSALTSDLPLDSLSSPQHAQHAVRTPGIRSSGLDEAQHAQHAAAGTSQPCTSREDLTASEGGVPQTGGSAHPLGSINALEPQLVSSSAALPSPASGSAMTASTGNSTVPGNAMRTEAGMRSHGKGRTSPIPSPPRFRRLPSNNLADRPAWASTTTSRGALPSSPGAPSPLRRNTGSSTMTANGLAPPPHPTTAAAAPKSAGSQHHITDSSTGGSQGVSSSAPRPVTLDGKAKPSRATIESHADYLVDSQAHAHAQALQQLQQAMEEYNSSNPHVLVPTAVELAAALRHAAKGPGPSKPSLEALQLPGLRVSRRGGDGDSPRDDVPATPWPQWVRGAWGSPQAQGRGAAESASVADAGGEKLPAAALRGKDTPQHAQRDSRVGADPYSKGWSPVNRPDSSAGRRRSALVRRALAEAEATAAKGSTGQAVQAKPKGSSKAARVAPVKPRASATPPRGAARTSWGSATPPRSSVTPPRAAQQAGAPPPSGALQHNSKLHANLTQASKSGDSQVKPSHNLTGHPMAVVRGSQPPPRAKSPPARVASVQSKLREDALQAFGLNASAQRATAAKADRNQGHARVQPCDDMDQPQHSSHAEAPPAASRSNSNAVFHCAERAAAVLAGPQSNSQAQPHAGIAPLHSVTSVAALRLSFEQMSPQSVASVKPRNRLPLRKVSSKPHVLEDDGSPQQAAVLWQQSLRGAEIHSMLDAVEHAEPDQAIQQGDLTLSKPQNFVVVVSKWLSMMLIVFRKPDLRS